MAETPNFNSKEYYVSDRDSQSFLNLEQGTLISERYTVEHLLGRGSSGTVYLCKDLVLGGLAVAVKLFPRLEASDQNLIRRMYREMLTCNKITHQNVTKFYDCIYSNKYVGYSMEYVDGYSMTGLLEKNQNLPFPFVLGMFRQLIEGLSAIHAVGVVHRDIKPSNLLITKSGCLKISDFGVATQRTKNLQIIEGFPNFESLEENRPIDTYTYTQEGCFVGTPRYLSPEYIEYGYSELRSDLYACGIILYELITQSYPFQYDKLIDLLRMKVEGNPTLPSEYRKDCPIELESFMMQLISKNPNSRFSSTQNVLIQLKELAAILDYTDSAGITYGSDAAAIDSYLGTDENQGQSSKMDVEIAEGSPSPSLLMLTLITLICFFGSMAAIIFARHSAFQNTRNHLMQTYSDALQELRNLPIFK